MWGFSGVLSIRRNTASSSSQWSWGAIFRPDMTTIYLGVPPALQPYTRCVGALCYEWSHLEVEVCDLLMILSKMPDDGRTRAILRLFDFRAKLSALKIAAVAYLTDYPRR